MTGNTPLLGNHESVSDTINRLKDRVNIYEFPAPDSDQKKMFLEAELNRLLEKNKYNMMDQLKNEIINDIIDDSENMSLRQLEQELKNKLMDNQIYMQCEN